MKPTSAETMVSPDVDALTLLFASIAGVIVLTATIAVVASRSAVWGLVLACVAIVIGIVIGVACVTRRRT